MKGKKFKHLYVPDRWEQYWSKYPQGYTILEALINWVSQVDKMVDNVNDWNMYLDDFVKRFDTDLQKTVETTLLEWHESGFLGELINDVLQTQIDEFEKEMNTKFNNFTVRIETGLDNTNKRIDLLVIASGNANAEVDESKLDYIGDTHDLLNERLIADTNFIFGVNNNTLTPIYSGGRLVGLNETSGSTVIRTTEISYSPGEQLEKIQDTINGRTVETIMNYSSGQLISVERNVV